MLPLSLLRIRRVFPSSFLSALASHAREYLSGLALLWISLIFCTHANAQYTASIEGQITDPHNEVIPNVKISVISPKIGIKRFAVTDDSGIYQIAALPVGQYRIETIPGFGNTSRILRQVFTLNETHIFGPSFVNEVRLGFNRFSSATTPNAQLNPAEFGINNGIAQPIGLPQITVAGGLNFGGPAINPSGRGDTTFIVSDAVSYLLGRHSLKFGGEFRQFLNNNFRQGTGRFNFPSIASFTSGNANSFSVTLGSQSSSIAEGALGFYVQDNFSFRRNLTFELGFRYDWNMTPTEPGRVAAAFSIL